MPIKHIGNAVFVETEPMDISGVAPKEWTPARKGLKAYAYVEFPSLERAYYGIFLTRGGPEDEEEGSKSVGMQTWEQPVALYWDVADAFRELGEKYAFEENPFVEVTDKKDYDRVLLALADEDPDDPKSWSPRAHKALEEGDWTGPGLYDFRERPPSKAYDSALEYEILSMEEEADQTLDYMYQGEDWEKELRELLAETTA
jgi:hypothetical protein